MIELGTKVSLDEFLNNEELRGKVKRGIKGLYADVMAEAEKVTKKKGEDAVWELAKGKIISPILVQELIDVLQIVKNIDSVDNEIIYAMLVRIMEDLEQLYIALAKMPTSQ
ncbi:MAG: hypothetical protein JZD40_01960 [Sulfolobus sp.]|nr:hypothetical protein [Sulfolobus sp.]